MARRRNRRPNDPASTRPEARTFRVQKRGIGRPPLPPGEALDATFTVRVRAEEKRRFEALAAAAGLSLTQWARRKLNEAAGSSSRPPSSKAKRKA